MNEQIKTSVLNFLDRAKCVGQTGHIAKKKEVDAINEKLGGIIAGWYIELITTYPICGIEFQWQEFPQEDDFDGRSWVSWSSPNNIWLETHEAYPGAGIVDLGYFNIGCDESGMGDPYFMCSDTDDPKVLHVYHEGVLDAETKVGDFDAGVASTTLSGFLDKAIFEK